MMRRSLFLLVNFEAVFMPALSPSMETGTIVEWKKKVGDLVKEGDVFCTVQTDKAVADYTNSFDPGYLAKIFVNNGQEATVAKTIAVLVDNADDVAKADEFKLEDGEEEAPAPEAVAATPEPVAAAPAPSASQPAAAAASGTTSELPDGVTVEPVFMPALSPSMETGTIVEWKKKVGDLVKEGDVFCTVQTDKAVADYTNSFDPGYLAKIYCQNGEEATVGLTIGVLVEDKAMIEKLANYRPEDAAGAAPAATPAATPAAPKPTAAATPGAPAQALYGGSVDAAVAASGPSVIRIAAGLEPSVLASITPTGKDGRFLKADFVGQPGFDYNDAAPARAVEAHGGAAAPAASKSKSADAAPKAPAMGSDYYSVVIQPAFVKKSVDDTAVLKHLISTMTLPKPKPKKDAKAAN